MKVTTPRHLPDGWSVVTIGDVAEVTPRLNKADVPDNLPVSFVPMPAVGAGDGAIDINQERLFSEVKKGFTSFQEGDVLFAKITPCMENGKMAVVPKVKNGYGFGSTEFHVLRPKEGMDARYLYYYISNKSFRNEAAGHMAGAVGQKRVPTAYLKECKIPVAPLPEQKRIVAEIEKQFSRLEEAVANLKRVKTNLKRYKAAVLKAAVEGKLTEQWRKEHPNVEPASKLLERILAEWGNTRNTKNKHKQQVRADAANLSKLPEGWVWATLDQICPLFVDSAHRTPKYSDSGSPALRPRDVVNGNLDLRNAAVVSEDEFKIQTARHIPQAGDIIYSRELSFGWAVEVPQGIKLCLSQGMCLFRPHQEVSTKYFIHLLNGPTGRHQAEQAATGSAHPHINLSDIRAYIFPLPPLEEQRQIASEINKMLSEIEYLELSVDKNIIRSERSRQALLSAAFSGKLVNN